MLNIWMSRGVRDDGVFPLVHEKKTPSIYISKHIYVISMECTYVLEEFLTQRESTRKFSMSKDIGLGLRFHPNPIKDAMVLIVSSFLKSRAQNPSFFGLVCRKFTIQERAEGLSDSLEGAHWMSCHSNFKCFCVNGSTDGRYDQYDRR